jgi:hypothetical protein
MGTRLTGSAAKIVSVTGSTDLEQLLVTALRDTELTFNTEADQEETSGKGDGYFTAAQGLANATLDFTGLYPRSAPRYGASGLLTIDGHTFYGVQSWNLDFDFGEDDITGQDGTAKTARDFMPLGFPRISGSLTAHADSASALSSIAATHAAGGNVVFKLTEDGGADPSFTGTSVGLVGKLGFTTTARGVIKPTYDFIVSGQLTSVAGSSLPALLPAGTVDASDWDLNSDGSADVSLVFQTAASRTYTGNAFLRSLSVKVGVGELIGVSGSIRFTGAVTPA